MYEATNLPTRRRQNQQQNGLGVTQPSKNTDPHTNTQQKNKQTQKVSSFIRVRECTSRGFCSEPLTSAGLKSTRRRQLFFYPKAR
jgi:hypothetical protein